MLLNALAAIGLLAKREGVFHNSPAARRYFTAGSPDNARPGAAAHRESVAQVVHAHRRRAGRNFGGGRASPGRRRGLDPLLSLPPCTATPPSAVGPVIRAVGTAGVRRMFDRGPAAPEAYSIAFAKAEPALRADILDVGGVAPDRPGTHRPRRRPGTACGPASGDLRSDPLGEGYDLVFVSAICHMLDERENRDLLARCHRALAPGGRVRDPGFHPRGGQDRAEIGRPVRAQHAGGVRAPAVPTASRSTPNGWPGRASSASTVSALPGPADLMVGTR